MKILVGGDFAPTEYNYSLFINGEAEKLYTKQLMDYLSLFDYRIFDFECCFDCDSTSINKFGPILTAPIETMNGIKSINPSIMILANNHVGNLGEQGICFLKEAFLKEGISCFGAGRNLAEAKKPYIINKDNIKVGMLAFAEHEFMAAEDNSAGVNPYDPLTIYEDIRELKREVDHVICFYHGGLIDYRYPLPKEQKALRKMIDYGADIVIGQHTHCIGCCEIYKGKQIIYGQGDFLFARPTDNEYRKSGLLIELDIKKEKIEVTYEVRIKPQNVIRMATESEKKEIIEQFAARNEEINQSKGVLCDKIIEEVLRTRNKVYMSALFGKRAYTVLFRGINKITKGKYVNWLYNQRFRRNDSLRLANFMECEAHNEVFSIMLKYKGIDL